jgi:sugar diacid utilization regulator
VSTLEVQPVRLLAERISVRREDLAREMVERYREEIVDYRLADEDFVFGDVYDVSLDNLEGLLERLGRDEPPDEERLERTRRGAARRIQQGISLEAFLHATRLWGQTIWETVLGIADPAVPAEREAALHIAGDVMRHVDLMSTTVAAAYLAEAEGVSRDRELVRRDLLDGLIAGTADPERLRRLARRLRVQLREDYVVILARGADTGDDEVQSVALWRVIEAARATLRPAAGSLLVGMRQGEVVALYPVDQPAELDAVRHEAGALAQALAPDAVSVGMSGFRAGLGAIGVGYEEAAEAVTIALGTGTVGRAVAFDQVLIDHMVRSSPHGDRLLDGTLRPLLDYDSERQAELVPTLRAYVTAGFNLTRAAELLCVHPNTVVYRLRRIRELSGRDPHEPEDLLLLFLGLKLTELRT